jgi:5-(carboxyamino)imidazole ribonucleotide mutase
MERQQGEQPAAVVILMGSDSDWEVMRAGAVILEQFGVPFEVKVSSAHRTPERTQRYAAEAAGRGVKVMIAGAGAAAHLAGVVAAATVLPVIGVPLSATSLQGLDALLATVQMPGGIPVATMAIGVPGARNAALFALRILALQDEDVARQLAGYQRDMVRGVEARDAELQHRSVSEFRCAVGAPGEER